jgi:hypothetical protein
MRISDPADRRRSPRVQLVGQLMGELVSLPVPIAVREISLGGMSFESPRLFHVGARHQFVLTLGDGAGVVVTGRIVYSHAAPRPAKADYVSGVQFLDDDDTPAAPPRVGGLIQKLT